MNSALTYALNPDKARDYVWSRCDDAAEILHQGLGRLPYVRVYTDEGKYVVGDIVCPTMVCALAYILAKWW